MKNVEFNVKFGIDVFDPFEKKIDLKEEVQDALNSNWEYPFTKELDIEPDLINKLNIIKIEEIMNYIEIKGGSLHFIKAISDNTLIYEVPCIIKTDALISFLQTVDLDTEYTKLRH